MSEHLEFWQHYAREDEVSQAADLLGQLKPKDQWLAQVSRDGWLSISSGPFAKPDTAYDFVRDNLAAIAAITEVKR